MPYYREAITLYEQLDNTEREHADCLYHLAMTLGAQGQLTDVGPIFHEALELYKSIEDTRKEQAECLYGQAIALSYMGK